MKFIVVAGKMVRADRISAAERIAPGQTRVLVGDTWIELARPIDDLHALLEAADDE